jgi:hypothetical protein
MNLVLVGAWYILWQPREFVKGKPVAPAGRTDFSIKALAANYCVVQEKVVPRKSSVVQA